jgi:hypothetical protein
MRGLQFSCQCMARQPHVRASKGGRLKGLRRGEAGAERGCSREHTRCEGHAVSHITNGPDALHLQPASQPHNSSAQGIRPHPAAGWQPAAGMTASYHDSSASLHSHVCCSCPQAAATTLPTHARLAVVVHFDCPLLGHLHPRLLKPQVVHVGSPPCSTAQHSTTRPVRHGIASLKGGTERWPQAALPPQHSAAAWLHSPHKSAQSQQRAQLTRACKHPALLKCQH